MKKIISFSLFGNNYRYLNGAIINAILSKHNFPDWDIVYYIWDKNKFTELERIIEICQQLNPKISFEYFDFNESDTFLKGLNPKFLRFLIHDNSNYNFYMIRDIDCGLCYRTRQIIDFVLEKNEVNKFGCINDFIDNEASYFIAGGFYGFNNNFFNMRDEIKLYFDSYSYYYDVIKKFLNVNELTSEILYMLHKQILYKDSGLICENRIEIEHLLYSEDERFLKWLIHKYKDNIMCYITEDKPFQKTISEGIQCEKITIPRLDEVVSSNNTYYYRYFRLF